MSAFTADLAQGGQHQLQGPGKSAEKDRGVLRAAGHLPGSVVGLGFPGLVRAQVKEGWVV